MKCKKCAAKYCGKECYTKDWSRHKKECIAHIILVCPPTKYTDGEQVSKEPSGTEIKTFLSDLDLTRDYYYLFTAFLWKLVIFTEWFNEQVKAEHKLNMLNVTESQVKVCIENNHINYAKFKDAIKLQYAQLLDKSQKQLSDVLKAIFDL